MGDRALWHLLRQPYCPEKGVSVDNPMRGRMLCALIRSASGDESGGGGGGDGTMSERDCRLVARFLGVEVDHEAECAIPYCEYHDGASPAEPLVPVCASHSMHRGCLVSLLKNSSEPVCPLCRDSTLSVLRAALVDTPAPRVEAEEFDSRWLTHEDGDEEGETHAYFSYYSAPVPLMGMTDSHALSRNLMSSIMSALHGTARSGMLESFEPPPRIVDVTPVSRGAPPRTPSP